MYMNTPQHYYSTKQLRNIENYISRFTNSIIMGKTLDVYVMYMYIPVSQIWALIILPSTWILRVANSTPMVLLLSRLNSFLVNRERRLLFPTPESPINTTVWREGERGGREREREREKGRGREREFVKESSI